jgi:hypothetical protein
MRLLTRTVIALLACVLLACEADAPTAPTTPPPATPPPAPMPAARANLQPFGAFQWTNCFDAASACTFTAQLRNVGNGCAEHVGGTVRLFSLGVQIGLTYQFVLPAQQIVNVGEPVPYFVPFVPSSVASEATDYIVTPSWIDTPCF